MSRLSDSAPVRLIGEIQKKLIGVLLVIIPTLITLQVLLRYVFQAPLMGIEEILLFPAVWLYFLGGSEASRARTHIDCGVLVLYIRKDRSLAIFRLVRTALSFIIGLWTLYYAFWFFQYSLSKWKLSDLLYIPMFIGESAIFIGLLLMVFFTFIELVDRIADLRAPGAKFLA